MFFYRMPNGELINLRHVVRIEFPSTTQVNVHFDSGPPAVLYTVNQTDLKDVLAQLKLINQGN